MPRSQRSHAARLARALALSTVLALVGRHVVASWAALADEDWTPRHSPLALSFAWLLVGLASPAVVWAIMVRGAGLRANPWRVASGWCIADLGKYVPGKVWAVVGAGYFLTREGTRKEVAGTLAVLNHALALVAAGMCSLLAAPLILDSAYGWLVPVIASATLLGLLATHPRVFLALINRVLRMVGRAGIAPELSYRNVLSWTGLSLLVWAPMGAAFFFFVTAFHPLPVSAMPMLAGTLALAGTVGLLAFFAPAGLGVREGVLMITLARLIGMECAIVVSVAARIWVTIGELFLAAISALVLRLSPRTATEGTVKTGDALGGDS